MIMLVWVSDLNSTCEEPSIVSFYLCFLVEFTTSLLLVYGTIFHLIESVIALD